jgi:hypothetical protein
MQRIASTIMMTPASARGKAQFFRVRVILKIANRDPEGSAWGRPRSRLNDCVYFAGGWYPGAAMKLVTAFPSSAFQTRTNPSNPPEATRFVAGWNTTDKPKSV